ncbi:MAG: hypothetical protein IT436_13585 [Phycisphaerales bacterium]|nr:hypothetical protein [Phycisphaerales bacterium]
MNNRFLVVCDGRRELTRPPEWKGARLLELNSRGTRRNVTISIKDITTKMVEHVPPIATDLVEIASFVYSADQSIERGRVAEFEYGLKWRRRMRFEIPVQNPEFWNRKDVKATLRDLLGFLSDDIYEFEFRPQSVPHRLDEYLIKGGHGPNGTVEEVVLFSGGLDSFAGAVSEIIDSRRKIALVSHRSTPKVAAHQDHLAALLGEQSPTPKLRPFHVPVEVNKGKRLTRDCTQRTRSFLFAALGATVARMFDLNRIRFYENGVVSINLPLSPQVLGGRATRTTHPRVLTGFGRLFSLVFDRPFEVENPYQWKTKTDVALLLKVALRAEWCAKTISCAHTISRSLKHPHCGRCSQCVDRRAIMLAAELDETGDPSSGYRLDPLVHEYDLPEDRTLVERYVGLARRVARIHDPATFAAMFPEAAAAFACLPEGPSSGAMRLFDLYSRHSRQVLAGLSRSIKNRSDEILMGRLGRASFLGLSIRSYVGGPASTTRPSEAASVTSCCELPAIDDDNYTIAHAGRICELRNTVECRVCKCLAESLGDYVSIEELERRAWGSKNTSRHAVIQAVSNLKRQLREAGLRYLMIDGRAKGSYRLNLQASRKSDDSLMVG